MHSRRARCMRADLRRCADYVVKSALLRSILTQHVQRRRVMAGSLQFVVLGLAGVHFAVHVLG